MAADMGDEVGKENVEPYFYFLHGILQYFSRVTRKA